MVEEARARFQEGLAHSHARFQEERDRQYEIYKLTCKGEQGARDRELAAIPPTDKAGIALAHDKYDKAVSRAGHIYERYEERAWGRYLDDASALRLKYGIEEVAL